MGTAYVMEDFVEDCFEGARPDWPDDVLCAPCDRPAERSEATKYDGYYLCPECAEAVALIEEF